MIDYQVRLINFKNGKIKECVVPNEDDSYTIFVEANLSREEACKEVAHALLHIVRGDFDSRDDDASQLENFAHLKGAI